MGNKTIKIFKKLIGTCFLYYFNNQNLFNQLKIITS